MLSIKHCIFQNFFPKISKNADFFIISVKREKKMMLLDNSSHPFVYFFSNGFSMLLFNNKKS